MSQDTKFHVEQVDPQKTNDLQAALNDIVEDEAVAELVDWETVDARRSGNYNVIIEYRPTAGGEL